MATNTLAGGAACAPASSPRESAAVPKVITDARQRFDVRTAGAPSELERRLATALMRLQDRADTACSAVQAAILALPNDTDADASRGVLELLEGNSVSLCNEMFDVAGMVLVAAQGCSASGADVGEPSTATKLRIIAADLTCGEVRLAGLFSLMCWVERARATLDRMSDTMKLSPEFAATVREHGIPTDADWTDEASNGLVQLMSEASAITTQLSADGAKLASAAAKGVCHE